MGGARTAECGVLGEDMGPLIYTQRVWHREAGTIVIISSGVSNAAVRVIKESSKGKIRLAKTQSAKLRPGCVYSRQPCPGQRRTKTAPAHDEITRRVLTYPMQPRGD